MLAPAAPALASAAVEAAITAIGFVGSAAAVGAALGEITKTNTENPSSTVEGLCQNGRPPETCEEEWEKAYEICEREIAADSNRGITGGYTDLYSCAKGLVSQRCGGNKVID
ncbi:hypothetical protein [Flavobacterium sp.]|uniref:hypothetical protein n=1 Tax=Flavobacterium sp. TaxID=239 RepID=UPI0025C1D807|nr:hypothetical protein [Flavobacterium sp.]